MQFQYVRVASLAAALLAASCATPDSARRSIAHASAPSMPTSLSRLEIAQNYRIESAPPVNLAVGADPSFALSHEVSGLKVGSEGASKVNSGASPASMALLTAAELPAGWGFDKDHGLQHAKSGLACPLTVEAPEENRRFLLRDIKNFDANGLDVGCNYSTDTGVFLTLYASFWPEMSLDDSLSGAVAAIRQNFDVKDNLPLPLITINQKEDDPLYTEMETPKAAAFDVGEVNGAPYKTAVWLVKTYGWHVKARATYPLDDQTSEIISALMFAYSHLNVRAKNMTDPASASSEV